MLLALTRMSDATKKLHGEGFKFPGRRGYKAVLEDGLNFLFQELRRAFVSSS